MSQLGYGVTFIDEGELESIVDALMKRAYKDENEFNIHRNVIDPFNALFEAVPMGMEMEDWFKHETRRQVNKTLTNRIGHFHQDLICLLPGWESLGRTEGVLDVICHRPFGANQTPVVAEVKNKYNTMNAGQQRRSFDEMQEGLRFYRDHTAYLIQIIQQRPSGDIPWAVAQRGERADIRLIGAPLLYELASGVPDAFLKVFQAIIKILEVNYNHKTSKALLEDLNKLFVKAFHTA